MAQQPHHPVTAVSSSTSATSSSTPTVTNAYQLIEASTSASKQSFSTMEDLRKKNPKLYQNMLLSICQDIIIDLQNHQDKVKQAMQDMRNT